MTVVGYDGSFAGLLTAIFEIYEYKLHDPRIVRDTASTGSLFGNFHTVVTNEAKAARVYKKINTVISSRSCKQLYDAYLSELKNIEDVIFRYIQYSLQSNFTVENDYSNAAVLTIRQTSKKVHREKHRMEAFVRFKLTADNVYYATIQPDYNVLPLICKHFKERYADQRWLIYDVQRTYGLYYNLDTVEEVTLNFSEAAATTGIFNDQEEIYQQLWQVYFAGVNIKARKNLKLHIQHMPRRYWRFLTEKQG
jgi:probable DNA metabolism protein